MEDTRKETVRNDEFCATIQSVANVAGTGAEVGALVTEFEELRKRAEQIRDELAFAVGIKLALTKPYLRVWKASGKSETAVRTVVHVSYEGLTTAEARVRALEQLQRSR